MSKIAPAVRKETRRIAIGTGIGVVLMWAAFAVGHALSETVPLDYTVFLGGIGGGIVAVLNFFMMGLMVQKVADTADDDMARSRVRASYSQRMMLQLFWIIIAIIAPCFNYAAGIAPLIFPSLTIKVLTLLKKV